MTLVLSLDQREGASLRPYTALCTRHTKPVGIRPSLFNTVGGLRTTILPGGRSAFKNAAVTSREAIVLNLDEAAQDKINLNIQVSRSVVVIFPYVSLV